MALTGSVGASGCMGMSAAAPFFWSRIWPTPVRRL